MIHKEFIQNLSTHLKLSKKKTSAYTTQLIEIIRDTLKKEGVDIRGFGKFIFQKDKRPKFQPDKKLIKEINIK